MSASPRALITGPFGQDGVLLSRLLREQGYEVWGLARPGDRPSADTGNFPAAQIIPGNIRDRHQVDQALQVAQPDEIYNLAALSSVGQSWDRAEEVMETNAVAVVVLLDAIREHQASTGRQVKFYQASSSEMFGSPPATPQDEQTPFHPRSPYGVAKAAAHFMTINYRESYGLFGCSGILYNHESELRPPSFVTRKITNGVARIVTGRADKLTLGDIGVTRDWGYAPDYVRAMWLMLQQPKPDDYIIATGESHTLEEFITVAFTHVGITDWRPYVEHDEALLRPAEVRGLVGNPAKARRMLGWRPTVPFEEIITRMVDHDLARLA